MGTIALWFMSWVGLTAIAWTLPWLFVLVVLLPLGLVLHLRYAWKINHAAGKKIVPWL